MGLDAAEFNLFPNEAYLHESHQAQVGYKSSGSANGQGGEASRDTTL